LRVVTVSVTLPRTLLGVDDLGLAERSLVSALVLSPVRLREVAGWLVPSDFAVPAAGLLYGRMLELEASGRWDASSLLRLLRDRGDLRRDGYPVSALVGWFDATPPSPPLPTYGRLVVEGRVARQLKAVGVRLVQVAETGGPARALLAVRAQRAVVAGLARELARLPGDRRPGRAELPPAPRRPVSADVLHAEEVTVGAALVSPVAAARVTRWLRPGDFSSPELTEVVAAVGEMRAASRPVDRVTVTAELRARGSTVAPDTLSRCEAAVPVAASVGFYARQVLASSIAGQVGAVGWQVAQVGERPSGDVATSVHATAEMLDGLAPLAARLRMASAPPPRSATVPVSPVRQATVDSSRW
jgi:replicative DNA helicase